MLETAQLSNGQEETTYGPIGKDVESLVLCYVTCPLEGDDYTGALLLTDSRTRPLHFSFVQPIRPTKMQRLLYGKTLDEHVKGDVIGLKLLDGIPQRPDIVFVDSRELICIRQLARVPVAFLYRTADGNATSEQLAAFSYDTGDFHDDRQSVGAVVAALDTIDLTDPFTRLRNALKEAIQTLKRGQAGQ